ncbi:amidohydrolase family protein [Streptomyces griseoviridis]|uniref:6-methylsalicylate decarboxylase n=1 Tax=Streptomyces hintoniae TaxID=3075521 RepID=A0ABU2UNG6_9ACTN|nr:MULTISPECIES: amidohydrolase family protein [unclassified Streptomyces]MDH6699382.1 putative TIM-barrel fold metal-dependent hydrolase [Streptomyces sp. MAA16]MDT0474481.1 amidohydrolase family protein [Streptomyces sp. DSM 41014]
MSEAPPFVDVHTHFVTERYVRAAREAGIGRPDGMPDWPSWSARGALALMDEARIGLSVLSVSSPGTHFGDDAAARALSREVNEFGAGLRRERPDRFGHFAALPLPDVEGALAEAAYALDVLGADGLAVETNARGVYLGDARCAPLWAELDRRGAIVFVHPTSPPGWEALTSGRPRPMMEFLFDTARAAADLVLGGVTVRHPGIRWILTHGGGALPLLAARLELFRTLFDGDGDLDVRAELGGLWYDLAGTPFPDQVPAVERAFGLDRVLYGSDSCWTPAPGVLAQVASIDAAEAPEGSTWRALTTRNARRLFSGG